MTKIRCKSCNKELQTTQVNKFVGCHCSNETYITLDRTGQVKISALDMNLVEIIEGSYKKRMSERKSSDTILSAEEIEWHENRKKRKVSRNLLNSVDIR